MDELCMKKPLYEPTNFVNCEEYIPEFEVSPDLNQFIQQYEKTLARLQEEKNKTDSSNKNNDKKQIAVCYHNLASVYAYKGDSKMSEGFFNKALEAYNDQGRQKKDLNIATIYHNLGWMYYQFEKTKKALKFCQNSLEIRKKCLGDIGHPDIALSYDNLSQVYLQQEDFKKALKFGETTLTMRKELYKDKPHSFLAESYFNVGLTLSCCNKYGRAIESFKNAEKIATELYGEHQDVAYYLKTQASVHFDAGKIYESVQCSLKALRIYSRLNIRNSDPGLAYRSLSDVQREKMDLKDSKQNLIRAYRFYLKAGERETVSASDAHSDILDVEKDLALTCNNFDDIA